MIRTRFAPSPTGYMHIGNLRTALYSYLIAKSNNGKFILRIEDTDQNRFIKDSEKIIFETLRASGLQHDEGPDIGGEYAPYVQSQRKEIYIKYALELISREHAYYCFCDKSRLNLLHENNLPYDRKCLSLSKQEIKNKILNQESYVIRQFIPEGKTYFEDQVYGHIEINNSELDDQVLIKSDGMPTYNFANVIDDHLMKITHVIRGCEYLSSTPKYNLIYKSFNWQIPVYVHLPLILNQNGIKLSKRDGAASFQDLIAMGFFPDAIINFIALLGWNPKDNQEIFSFRELENKFLIKNILKSPAIFDLKKLTWMNGEYIKLLDSQEFYKIAISFLERVIQKKSERKNLDYKKIADITQTRINFLEDINKLWSFIDSFNKNYDTSLFINKKFKCDLANSVKILQEIFMCLANLSNWKENIIKQDLINYAANNNLKTGQVFWPLLIALSGQNSTPCGATEIAELLDKQETLKRIELAINKLKI